MDIGSPRETGSMQVDTDGGAVSCRQPSGHSLDSVKMDSPGSDWGRAPSGSHSGDHQFACSIQPAFQSLPDDSPMVLAPSSPSATQLGETGAGDVRRRRRLAEQRRLMLSGLRPSIENAAPRKRKHTHISMTGNHYIPHDDTFIDATYSRHRRVRPRLQERRDAEFSPLLIMSPRRDPSAEGETISAFHFPPPVTDAPHPIRRYFHPEDPVEHGPRTLQSSSLAGMDDLEDPRQSGRQDSTSSFTEVALASAVAPKHGRLSTLQDFWLPRPFEETEQPLVDGTKVHERGLEVPSSFFSTNSGWMGGLGASRAEQAGSTADALGHSIRLPNQEQNDHAVSPPLPLEPASTTIYFNKPLCDSPDSIDSNEDRFGHPGPFRMQVDHVTRFPSAP